MAFAHSASLAAALVLASTLASNAASFDCDKEELAPDEQAICDDRALNDADVRMVTTFDLLTGLLAMGGRDSMRDEQTKWLAERTACEADVDFIRDAYDRRLKQLEKTYLSLNRPL